MKKISISFALLFLCVFNSNAQSVKAMYVNDFVDIIGDIPAENVLLARAQSGGYNYLILYNLYTIHNTLFSITDPVTSQPLADFIEKARTIYGITQVAGVGETYSSFDNIHDYNLDHAGSPNQQFDHYNIEFEFWNNSLIGPGDYYCTNYLIPNGLTCDTVGSFQFYKDNLCDLQALCAGFSDLDSETYIGWPNAGQSEQIADCTERVLVHYYRGSDVYMTGNSIYNYGSHRLPDLAESADVSVVMPIFNCRPSFMGTWLETYPEDQAFDTWMTGTNGYDDDMGAWKTNNIVDGHVWYRYTCMPAVALPIELLYFSGRKVKNVNLLSWQLEAVGGLKEMIIERADNSNFSSFTSIEIVAQPYGNNSYYEDETFSPGVNFYRLKFIDEDGSFEYSKTITLDNTPDELTMQWVNFFESSHLLVHSSIIQEAEINVYTINGQCLLSKEVQLKNGKNTIPINTSTLPHGIYALSLKIDREISIIKIFI